ncbi:MAG: phosphate/phosphite/phosphonate ABC transporter substrate-binding protein [Candidatus Muiribacteriota bacterium]
MKKKITLTLIIIIIFLSIILLYQKKNNMSREVNSLEKKEFVDNSYKLLRMPYASPLKIFEENHSLINFLSAFFDNEFKLLVPNDYDDISRIIKEGKAHIIWPATGYFLSNLELFKDYKIMFRPVLHGQDRYRGAVIVRKDSNLNDFNQLENKTFGFTDINSASGYRLPSGYIRNNYGVNPYEYFKDVKFLGTHQEVVLSVFYGEIKAGAVFEDAPDIFLEKNQRDEISIIEYTGYIMNEPVLIKKTLADELDAVKINKLIKEFPEEVCDDLGIDGIAEARLKEYNQMIEYFKE